MEGFLVAEFSLKDTIIVLCMYEWETFEGILTYKYSKKFKVHNLNLNLDKYNWQP